MPIVIDASVCSSWIIPDEQGPAEQLLPIAASDHLVVPGHFWFEIRNVLVMNERRKRMTPMDVDDALTQLSMFDWTIDTRPDANRIFAIARQFSLTFYDAAYVALAERDGLPIATLDKAMLRACRDLKLPTLLH